MRRICLILCVVGLSVFSAGPTSAEMAEFGIVSTTNTQVEILVENPGSMREVSMLAKAAADETGVDVAIVKISNKRMRSPEDGIQPPHLQGWSFAARFIQPDGAVTEGQAEPRGSGECINEARPETLCVSGALEGRPEIFIKIIGPRPNGKCFVQITRFTPAQVEVDVWPRGQDQTMVWMRETRLRDRNPTVIGVILNEEYVPFNNGRCTL